MAEYIDKSRLLNGLDRYDFPNDKSYEITFEVIDSAPIEDVAPVKHGRWIEESSVYVFCSNCKAIEHHRDYNFKSKYCPHCGAKMDLEG